MKWCIYKVDISNEVNYLEYTGQIRIGSSPVIFDRVMALELNRKWVIYLWGIYRFFCSQTNVILNLALKFFLCLRRHSWSNNTSTVREILYTGKFSTPFHLPLSVMFQIISLLKPLLFGQMQDGSKNRLQV